MQFVVPHVAVWTVPGSAVASCSIAMVHKAGDVQWRRSIKVLRAFVVDVGHLLQAKLAAGTDMWNTESLTNPLTS